MIGMLVVDGLNYLSTIKIKNKNMNSFNDLKQVIGKETSQNQSPTCRARLVKVNKVNSTFESVPSLYGPPPKKEFVGVRYKVPNWIAWNSFFY
jgi:hypothetical protein